VNGSAVSKSISFTEVKYTVTFTESGLPSGTIWYVNLSNGQSFKSTTSTISFSEPNGTYTYTISDVSGYSVSSFSGSIRVNGASISKTISFTPIKKSSPASGISSAELYGIIGAVIAVAVIGSLLAITRKKK
jgi:beta-lactam-binding protein with PASTA domain